MGSGIGNVLNGGIGGAVNSILGIKGTNAPTNAAGIESQHYQQAIDFLTKANTVPTEAQTALGEGYGLEGQAGTEKFMEQMKNSPIYASVMQQLSDEQNQTGASAAQKGLLGSGVLDAALARERGRAGNDIATQYLSGLQNLSAQNYNQPIAQDMIGKGQVIGEGIVGQAQSDAQTQMAGLNLAMQGAGVAAKAFGAPV